MASAGARAYNRGLGAELPAGPRGRAPGQGVRGRSRPEAENLLASGCATEAANLPHSVRTLTLPTPPSYPAPCKNSSALYQSQATSKSGVDWTKTVMS